MMLEGMIKATEINTDRRINYSARRCAWCYAAGNYSGGTRWRLPAPRRLISTMAFYGRHILHIRE